MYLQVVGMLAYYIWSGGRHLYGEGRTTCLLNLHREAPLLSHVTDALLLNLLCLLLHPDTKKRLDAQQALAYVTFVLRVP